MSSDLNKRKAPDPFERRLNEWRRLFKGMHRAHYFVGVLGIFLSSLAAYLGPNHAKLCAAGAALCIAVLGFVQPDRQYLKYVRAWRYLDAAILRFNCGLIGEDDLIKSLEKAENSIMSSEYDEVSRETSAKSLPVQTAERPIDALAKA